MLVRGPKLFKGVLSSLSRRSLRRESIVNPLGELEAGENHTAKNDRVAKPDAASEREERERMCNAAKAGGIIGAVSLASVGLAFFSSSKNKTSSNAVSENAQENWYHKRPMAKRLNT